MPAVRAQAMLSRWLGEAARCPLWSPPESAAGASADTHTPRHPHLQTLERQIDIAQSEADLSKAATKPDGELEPSYAQHQHIFMQSLLVNALNR